MENKESQLRHSAHHGFRDVSGTMYIPGSGISEDCFLMSDDYTAKYRLSFHIISERYKTLYDISEIDAFPVESPDS